VEVEVAQVVAVVVVAARPKAAAAERARSVSRVRCRR
jgi:hypothetical protein